MHSQMIDISVSAWCLRRLNFLSYPLAMGKSECSLRRALEVISLVVPGVESRTLRTTSSLQNRPNLPWTGTTSTEAGSGCQFVLGPEPRQPSQTSVLPVHGTHCAVNHQPPHAFAGGATESLGQRPGGSGRRHPLHDIAKAR